MKLSAYGLNLIKEFEAFMPNPYLDPANVPTIGYGSTYYANGQAVTMNDAPITEAQASNLMLSVMGTYEMAVTRYVQVTINQNMFDALVSFAYNVGIGALQRSTLLKKLNAGLYIEASAEFKRWVYADGKVLNGLITRRAKEKTVFLMPSNEQHEFTEVTQQEEKQMFTGYKTYIGIAISLISALATALGKDWGIDWTGFEVAITNTVAALITVYGYLKKEAK